jgi:hypothetical protein
MIWFKFRLMKQSGFNIMTRIYINLFMSFIVLWIVGLSAAFAAGHLRPINPVLDGMYQGCQGQPQPCWYGIHPGKTPLEDALHMVSQTKFIKMDKNDYIVTLVYRNANMRCGVELRSEAGIVDTVTIINCLDKQMGDLVRAMRNTNHKLPFSMGMLDATMHDESTDSVANYAPCLDYTPYGQIIGMPLSAPGESATTQPVGWHDFLPYGWYVHEGGSLSCDVVEVATKFS